MMKKREYQQQQQLQLQVAEQVSEKAKAMLAYQNAQFAAACLAKMQGQGGRCEGCGQ